MRLSPLNRFAIVVTENDNVAVAKKDLSRNMSLMYKGKELRIVEFIPEGQRFSLTDISRGKLLVQYGQPFGVSKGIRQGHLLNKYNVTQYHINYKELRNNVSKDTRDIIKKDALYKGGIEFSEKTFMGYVRGDERVGTRNYYLVVPTSLCASDIALKLANEFDNNKSIFQKYKNIDGVVAAAHTEGCGCNDGEIIDRLMLTLKNTIVHPNVGGALVIDLGCEKTNIKVITNYLGDLSICRKPVDFISIQGSGGTGSALAKGKNIISNRLAEVDRLKRKKVSIKHLVIGTECGASDSFSGITANSVIGSVVDKIICTGGSAILSETPEMLGAEAVLIKRMRSRKVVDRFIKGIDYYMKLADRLGVSMSGNLVGANEKGGLLTLTLKSLGAIVKGGSSGIVDFLDYAEHIRYQGLSIMNGPGNDLESMTGIVASGANIILFSTGMGTTEGNLITPVIKVSTRTEIYEKMKEDMDFNAGDLLDKDISLDELSDSLLDLVIGVASGRKTWSEIWKKRSFQIWTAGKLSL